MSDFDKSEKFKGLEKGCGRRPKMKKSGKNFGGVEFDRRIGQKLG
jgi:hypothetical protein